MLNKSQLFAAVLDDQIQIEAREQAHIDVFVLYEALVQNLEALGVSPLTVDVPCFIARIKGARAAVIASKRVAQLVATALAPASAAPSVASAGVQLGEVVYVQNVALGEHTKAKASGLGTLVEVRDNGIPQPGQIVGGVVGADVRHTGSLQGRPAQAGSDAAIAPKPTRLSRAERVRLTAMDYQVTAGGHPTRAYDTASWDGALIPVPFTKLANGLVRLKNQPAGAVWVECEDTSIAPRPVSIVGGKDGPELVDTSPADRPVLLPGWDDGELTTTVAALTNEVRALREGLRDAGARRAVIAFSTPK